MLRLGVDLGGTKIEVAVLDDAHNEVLRRRIDTPQGHYAATVRAVAALVRQAEGELGAHCSVGVGTPGSLSPGGELMRNANSVCLNGRPLKRDIEGELGRTIRMANDANCFALSEAIDGAAAGADSVFGVIIGTGVGGGIVLHGQVLAGANHIAGEWGHNPLPRLDQEPQPLPECYCGRRGCVETYLSGPALARDHARLTGIDATPAELVRAAAAGEACAEATLARYEQRLAKALAGVINLLDPDVIVLGGGLSNIERLNANVPRLWPAHVFSDVVATRLLRNRHGDSSGVRGAALLWPAR
jgi:predicted NBD/HSP70 family sugar kinase